jgi:hypothetical protein
MTDVPDRAHPEPPIAGDETEAPTRIATMTAGVPPGQLRASPQPGEWSSSRRSRMRTCVVYAGEARRVRQPFAPTRSVLSGRGGELIDLATTNVTRRIVS